MRAFDTLTNLIAGLAIGKAKTASDEFKSPGVVSSQFDAMYDGDWLARKIVNVPVNDMIRPWRTFFTGSKNVSEIEKAEKRHNVKAKIAAAMKTARLYGGAGILIGADTANWKAPLEIERLPKGGLKYLHVLPKRLLVADGIEVNPESPDFGRPKLYRLTGANGSAAEIHPSRVLRFTGAERLDYLAGVNDGWGDSELLAIYDAIHHAALCQGGIAEMIHDAKVDVIQIPNLGTMLTGSQSTTDLVTRFTNANMLKSINNMLLLDATEVYTRKQTTFAGLEAILGLYLQIVSGAADIPATRLLGTSAKGLNATGEGDLTNYYDALAGVREEKIVPQLEILDRILWRDALGADVGEDYFEWRPLWQPSEKEKAEVASKKAATSKVYVDMGILPDDVMARGIASQLAEDGVYPGIDDDLSSVKSAAPGFGEVPAAEAPVSGAGRPIARN